MVVRSGDHAVANERDKRPERDQRNSGQVKHDERGNAVWQWAADSARTAIQSTSQLLRKLNVSSLSLESDQHEHEHEPKHEPKHEKPLTNEKRPPKDTRGFDPYSSDAGRARRRSRPAAATPAATPQSAGSKHRRSWWQRLLRRD
jgi:hypothetical protein